MGREIVDALPHPPHHDQRRDDDAGKHDHREQDRTDMFELPHQDRGEGADGRHWHRDQSPELGFNTIRHEDEALQTCRPFRAMSSRF